MRAPFSGAPKASLTSKALTACAAATLALGLGVGTASALPPGGAKASTPFTSSTVSSFVSEHGVISFSVSGFPANTVVSVKVDDGDLCPSDAAQGACVVHQQKTDSNGNVSGSFVLPDVGAGTHTLRFLATGEKRDKDGKYLGTEAYTNRSPEFTVVGEGGSDNSSSNSSGSSSNRGSSSSKSNGGSSNSNSSDSADEAQGSSDSNESSSNGGSNGSSNGSAGGAAEAETVYTDADGNTITKEEYDRLNAEAGSSDTSASSGSSAAPAASASANAQKKATASASASSSAVARGTASSPSASASGAANTASTVQTVTYGAAFPWIGVVVLGVSIVGAAALLLTRKR